MADDTQTLTDLSELGEARGQQQMKNLRVFAGPEHRHEAQQPEVFDVAALNPKNKRSA